MREGTRTSLPSPPLLFIAFSTPHRSPLSERLEQARYPKTCFTQTYRDVWRRHAGARLDELQHGGRKPAKTSVTEFCYKRVNLFFEKLISIKVILFS